MSTKTCNKCGHSCHCDKPNCPDCVNDVCGYCDCEENVELGTDARQHWPGIDSGLDNIFT